MKTSRDSGDDPCVSDDKLGELYRASRMALGADCYREPRCQGGVGLLPEVPSAGDQQHRIDLREYELVEWGQSGRSVVRRSVKPLRYAGRIHYVARKDHACKGALRNNLPIDEELESPRKMEL
jgi:hypothetical protein